MNPNQATRRAHLLSTPPRREAFRHSGGERRLCTSATVTLYFDVELSRDSRPGTEQNTSLGFITPPKRPSLLMGMVEMVLPVFLESETGPTTKKHVRNALNIHARSKNPKERHSYNSIFFYFLESCLLVILSRTE